MAETRQRPDVKAFFDPATNTISYVVKDPESNSCAVIDSVMDIDYAAGRITYDNADEIIKYIEDNGLNLEWQIETHVHADHLSAAPYIQERLGGKIGVGENIKIVQDVFEKCSTRARNSSATVRSSTGCLSKATPTRSAI